MSAPTFDATRVPELEFGEFCSFVGDELGCELAGCEAGTLLVDELGWDSLAFFELLGLFDRLALDVPDELLGALRTLGDVHHYFTRLSAREYDFDSRSPRTMVLYCSRRRSATSSTSFSCTRRANIWCSTDSGG